MAEIDSSNAVSSDRMMVGRGIPKFSVNAWYLAIFASTFDAFVLNAH